MMMNFQKYQLCRSGITFKSDPEDEYEECLTKIDALKKSLS